MQKPTDFPLPPNLARPIDDGGADHLRDVAMPPVSPRSTAGRMVNLEDLIYGKSLRLSGLCAEEWFRKDAELFESVRAEVFQPRLKVRY